MVDQPATITVHCPNCKRIVGTVSVERMREQLRKTLYAALSLNYILTNALELSHFRCAECLGISTGAEATPDLGAAFPPSRSPGR